MDWYLKAFKQYATFDGRAQRAEYWYFMLFYFIGFIIVTIVDSFIGTYNVEAGMGVLGGIFMLVHFLPSIGVSIRRLHDIGKSGWWYLLILIPLIGSIVLLIFFVLDSKEDNVYGPNPKLLN